MSNEYKIYDGDVFGGNNTDNEYTIRKAVAGNWCLDITPYSGEVRTYCNFETAKEAFDFCEKEEGGKIEFVRSENDDEQIK